MKEEEIINQDVIYYRRDEKGKLIGIKYDNNEYYYIKNLQEDIIGITDSNNNLLCSYVYDSWGKILSIKDNEGNDITDTSHIGLINPFRYRSYYYDEEIGLYYLNSRYYNPEWGRFINCDEISGEIGNVMSHNMYVYAFNNSLNYIDGHGDWPKWLKNAVKKVVVGLAAITVGVILTVATGGSAVPALTAGLKAAAISGGITSGISTAAAVVSSVGKGKSLKETTKKVAKSAVDGFSNGFMAGGIMAGASQTISAGFKIAAKNGVAAGRGTGIEVGPVNILSPDKISPSNLQNGGTLINFNNGFRFDVGSSTLLHCHIPYINNHIPFGIIISSLYGVSEVDED